MTLIISILSTLTLGIGLFGLLSPAEVSSFVSRFSTKSGFWTAVALRLVFGVALWRAAPASRAPAVLQALGVMSAMSAVALPLIGFRRFQAILSWWSRQPAAVVRAWSIAAVVMGAFLVWSVH